MNPQPHPFVGQLGVLIIALLTVYFSFTNKKRNFSFSDEYVIGYINDNIPCAVQTVSTKHSNVKVNKKKSVPLEITYPTETHAVKPTKTRTAKPVIQKVIINQELFNDCILALVSLGTKKTQAREITKNIFEQHNPQTIEEFIKFVYIK